MLGLRGQSSRGKPLQHTRVQSVSPSPSPRKGQGHAVGGAAPCLAPPELLPLPPHPLYPLSHNLNQSCCLLLPPDEKQYPPRAEETVCVLWHWLATLPVCLRFLLLPLPSGPPPLLERHAPTHSLAPVVSSAPEKETILYLCRGKECGTSLFCLGPWWGGWCPVREESEEQEE